MSPLRGEDGSGTVLVIAAALCLAVLSGVMATLGLVAVARHRAASAADLAALAAAGHVLDGPARACAAAEGVARAVGGTLVVCRIEGAVAYVVVQIRPTGALGRVGAARAQAQAGPR